MALKAVVEDRLQKIVLVFSTSLLISPHIHDVRSATDVYSTSTVD